MRQLWAKLQLIAYMHTCINLFLHTLTHAHQPIDYVKNPTNISQIIQYQPNLLFRIHFLYATAAKTWITRWKFSGEMIGFCNRCSKPWTILVSTCREWGGGGGYFTRLLRKHKLVSNQTAESYVIFELHCRTGFQWIGWKELDNEPIT